VKPFISIVVVMILIQTAKPCGFEAALHWFGVIAAAALGCWPGERDGGVYVRRLSKISKVV
jgi:hypothetical protein